MAFGAKITLSVDKSAGARDEFKRQIEQFTNSVNKKSIKLTNFKAHLSAGDRDQIIKDLQASILKKEIKIKVGSIDASAAIKHLREQLTSMLSGLSITGVKDFIGNNANMAPEQIEKMVAEAKLAGNEIKSLQAELARLYKGGLNLSDNGNTQDVIQKYRDISAELERIKTLKGEEQTNALNSAATEVNALRSVIDGYREKEEAARQAAIAEQNAAKNTAEEQTKAANYIKQVATLRRQIEQFMNLNPKAYSAYKGTIDKMVQELNVPATVDPTRLAELKANFASIGVAARDAGLLGKTFFQTLTEGFKKFGGWSIVTRTLTLVIRGFRNAVSAVKELDLAMTELRKVTDLTSQQYQAFFDNAARIAQEVGAKMSDTINATADFARLGYNLEDATKLAETALMYKNVGDGIGTVADATESMISTIKAFGKSADDAMHIIDAFNEVGNNFSISSTGIGEALQRSASAMAAAGNTLEESIGLIVAMNDVVQNPEVVGTTLKTVSMYLRAAKTEAEEAGISTDGMAESVSKLRSEILALTGSKVDIMIDDNTFKSTFQIVKEISGIWNTLQDTTQARLEELMGGKRGGNSVVSLITNFADAMAAAETAENSYGSALRENETYMDSIAGKTAKMQAAFENFAAAVIDSSVIKALADIGTAFSNIGAGMAKWNLMIPSILTAIKIINGFKAANVASKFTSFLTSATSGGLDVDAVNSEALLRVASMTNLQKNLAKAQLETAMSTGAVSAEIGQSVAAMFEANGAATGFSFSLNSLKTAIRGVGAAFHSWTTWFLAISLAITLASDIARLIEEGRQASIDAANEISESFNKSTKSYEENVKSLNGMKTQFDELAKGVDSNGNNVSLTNEEYETFLSLIDRIVEISPEVIKGYDEQGNKIIEYKNALEQAIEAQEKLNKETHEGYIVGGQKLFEGNLNSYKNYATEMRKAGQLLGSALLSAGTWNNPNIEYRNILNGIGVPTDLINYTTNMYDETFITRLVDQLSTVYERSEDVISALRASGIYTDKQIDDIRTRIYGLQEYYNNIKAIQEESANWIYEWSKDQNFYQEIPLAALDEYKNGLLSIIDVSKSFDVNKAAAGDLGNELVKFFTSDQAHQIIAMTDGLITQTVSVEKYKEAVNGISSSWDGTDAALAVVISFFNSFINTVDDSSQSVADFASHMGELSDAIKTLESTYKILETARSEMAEDGRLSNETVQDIADMLEEGEKLTDYVYAENGALKLNEQAWENRGKKVLEANRDSYLKSIDAMQKYLDALETVRIYEAESASYTPNGKTRRDTAYGITNGPKTVTVDEYVTAKEYIESVGISSKSAQGKLEGFEQELAIINAILANIGENVESNPLDFSEFFEGLDDIQGSASGLISALNSIASGSEMTKEEFAKLAMEYPELLSNMDMLGNIGDAEAMITSALDSYETKFHDAIENKINDLEEYRKELMDAGQSTTEVDNIIGNLSMINTMTLDDLFGDESISNMEKYTTALDDIRSAFDLFQKSQKVSTKSDQLSTLSSIVKLAQESGKPLSDFVSVVNKDLVFSENGFVTYVTGIIEKLKELKNEDGTAFVDSGIIEYLESLDWASQEAEGSVKSLSDVLGTARSVQDIFTSINEGNYDVISMLSDLSKIAEESGGKVEDFLEIGEGGELGVKDSALTDYVNGLVNELVAAGEIAESTGEKIKEALTLKIDSSSDIQGYKNAISDIRTANELLAQIDDNGKSSDVLSSLESVFSIIEKNPNIKLSDIVSVENEEYIFDVTPIEAWIDESVAATGATEDFANAMKALVKEAEETGKFSTSLNNIGNAFDLWGKANNISGVSEELDMLSSLVTLATEAKIPLSDFVSVIDGKLSFTSEGFTKYISEMINTLSSLEIDGEKVVDPKIIEYLNSIDWTAVQAEDSVMSLSDAIGSIKSVNSIFESVASGNYDLLDVLNDVAKIAEESGGKVEDFLEIGEGGQISLKNDAYNTYINGIIDKLEEAGTVSEETGDILRNSLNLDGVVPDDGLTKLENAVESVRTASTLLSQIDENGKSSDFLSTLESVISIVNNTEGKTLDDFFTVEDGKVIFNTQAIRDWVDSVIDASSAPEELKAELKSLASQSIETAVSFEEMSNAISAISSAQSFIQNIASGEQTTSSMIQSAMEMARTWGDGHDWTEFVAGFDAINGIIWDESKPREYTAAMLDAADAATGLEEKFPGIKAFLLDELTSGKATGMTLTERMEAFTNATKEMSSVTDAAQLTYEEYQKLIQIDERYAGTVEYMNGVLRVNRDEYEAVTNKLLEETRAQALNALQAKLSDEAYKDFISRKEELSAEEQKTLEHMNAEIAGYTALISELNNATSAYNRFLRASSNANAETYTVAQSAYDVINQTLNDETSELYGKRGREQFTAAIELLISPDVEVDTPEFDKAFETVQRYMQGGADGINELQKDLVENGFIDANNNLNAGLDDMANTLGVSSEFLQSMFEEWNTYLPEDQKFVFSADTDSVVDETNTAEQQLEELQQMITELGGSVGDITGTEISFDTSAAEKSIDSLSDKLESIAKEWIVTIKTKTEGNVPTLHQYQTPSFSFTGSSAASGSNGAGGKTLVGEIGREIVVNPATGEWYTVGDRGAEIVNLPKGAIVFNHKQTEDILGYGSTSSRGVARANGIDTTWTSGAGGNSNWFTNTVNKLNKTLKDVGNVIKGVGEDVSGNVKNNGGAGALNSTGKNNDNGGGGNAADESKKVEELAEKYEEANKQLEHLIAHQEYLYKVADKGLNFDGMEASLTEQARLYKEIMDNANEAVQEMIAAGADDTDENLQKMEETAWAAYENMYATFDKIRALYTDALNTKIDDIQTGYSNLQKAADEFAESGTISIDTFQELTNHGLQYMSLLKNSDGQYEINTEGIKKMIEAEKEQLAIETALSYISRIREALGDGETNRIAELIDVTQQISDSTWNAVYAQAALLKDLGLSEGQYEQLIFNIEAMRSAAEIVQSDISAETKAVEETNDAYEDQEAALDRILEFTEDLIRAETEDRIQAIKDEIEGYRKIIEVQKESLRNTKEQNDYEQSVADKVKEIAELQARADRLALDGTREAMAERAKLMEDLADKQNELTDFQADHAYEVQSEAYDKMAEDYEESRQPEIDALEESISSTEKVYQLALERIRTGWSDLYDDLIAWNTEQGNVINQEITENWNLATEAVKEYGSYTEALKALRNLDTDTKQTTPEKSFVVAPKYHSGGIVGEEGSINDSEVVAVLEKGEIVLDKEKKNALYKIVDFQKMLSEKLGVVIGDMMSSGAALAQRVASTVGIQTDVQPVNQTISFSPNIDVNINYSGNADAGAAASFGEQIANSAIDKLFDAFEKRGVGDILGSRLRKA